MINTVIASESQMKRLAHISCFILLLKAVLTINKALGQNSAFENNTDIYIYLYIDIINVCASKGYTAIYQAGWL